jgi:hypothetical protein
MSELATKTNQLLEEINKIRFMPKVDRFTLIRLEREAQKLLSVDALHAYQFLGILASFRGDVIGVKQNYKKATNLVLTQADKIIFSLNYAESLLNIGFFSESLEQVKDINFDDLSSKMLKSISATFILSGLFHYAANLVRKYQLIDAYFTFSFENFMDEHGITDEQFQKLIEIGVSILHKHQFFDFRNSTEFEFTEDEYSKWLCFVIKIDRSVDEIVEMKYELACALAESDLPTELLLNFIVAYEIAGE